MNIFKAIFYFFLGAILLLISYYIIMDEQLPKGEQGAAADELATAMVAAVNAAAWDTTYAVKWTYRSPHYHIWDRKRNLAQISWEGYEVLIDIDGRRGLITKGGDELDESSKAETCEKAWQYWVNDSFWLNPITKVFDPGTERRLVKQKDGSGALLVTYTSGGATPGDSYLWILDVNNRPVAWKLWVSILPMGGIKFTWEDWIALSTGAMIATKHQGLIEVPIKDVQGAATLGELTGGVDIFSQLVGNGTNTIAF